MENERTTIKPEIIGGTRDYMPATMIARQKMLDTIRGVYERFGFSPLDTPSVERLGVLTGNDLNFNMQLFRTLVARGANKISPEDLELEEANMALRFDLTVPLARVVAANPELPKPFKRYQVGNVWRGERPQLGRFREFAQFDADIIGSRSMLADTEIVNVMYEVMKTLGFKRFLIRINNRKLLNGLLSMCPSLVRREQNEDVLRILDKAEKTTGKEIVKMLSRKPENVYDESAPALSEKEIALIMGFLEITGESSEILDKAETILKETELGMEGIAELREITTNLQAINIPQTNWTIDLSIARGLGYYTGPVFETSLLDIPEIGSVYSGGRFDGLTNRFIPGSNIPGVGASVGVDRLFVAMEKLEMIELKPSVTQVLIALFDSDLQKDYLQLASTLRELRIPTEIYLNNEPLGVQLGYAAKLGIPFVVIIGSNESKANKISLRNMATRKQVTIDKEGLIAILTQDSK